MATEPVETERRDTAVLDRPAPAHARRIEQTDLPHGGSTHRFEGHTLGDIGVSFFLSDGPPGSGPGLHRHPYAEVFVVPEGRVDFQVGETTIEATAGQIVVAPPGLRHRFVNVGPGRSRHLDIHASGTMVTEWLAD